MFSVALSPSQQRRRMLAIRDAPGLDGQFGFTPLAHPERLMEIVDPNPYRLPPT